MTVLQYMAKFTKLAHFVDDYMTTNLAKVRRFEDGLKLFIRDKIVGHHLQELYSMVEKAMAIERKLNAAKSIREASTKDKKNEGQSSNTNSSKKKTSTPQWS